MVFGEAISFMIAPLGMLLLFALVLLAVVVRYANIWLQANMAGIPVNILEILGMTFRKVNANAVVQALIMAKQGGVTVSRIDLEMAYLRGVNVKKVVLAFIEAKKQGMEITFEELVAADQEERHRGVSTTREAG